MKIKEKHRLRKPGGPYTVGCTGFVYEYSRRIPCLCFYPARDPGKGKLKKYAGESILPGGSGITTNSYTDAPVSAGKHPLLLFSHGLGLGCEANTVQFEELASHGYIVLSIGHQGDGRYALPGGEILLFDMDEKPEEFQADAAAVMEIFPRYGTWLSGDGKNAGLGEHGDYYKTIIDSQTQMVAQAGIWIKDSLAALEMFLKEAGQQSSLLHNHVDKESIGAFGMSFGGSIALSLAQSSRLIKASANLDGFFYSPAWQKPLGKPVLLLQHDSLGGHFLTFPFLNAAGDAYLATVKNSTHGNFMDYNEILAENLVEKAVIGGQEVELPMLGEINPDKIEDIINSLLLDFFDKYLRGKASQVLDTDNPPGDVILLKK